MGSLSAFAGSSSFVIPVLTLAVLVGVGFLVAFTAMATAGPSQADVVAKRIRKYEGAEDVSLEELELRAPFSERVIRPTFARAAELLAKRTPESTRMELNRMLNLAGRPLGLSAAEYTALRYVLGAALALAGSALAVLTGQSLLTAVVFIVVGVAIGYFGPYLYVRSRAGNRRTLIVRGLPNALDLLQISVEAGLSLEAAMARVAEKDHSPLADEFARVLQETRLGRPRLEALEEMVVRSQVEELSGFVQAVIQSEELGTPIASILRVQSEEIRQKRLVRAQIKGAQASLKMLLPMIAFIFPTIWVILLGPALLIVMKVFS